MIDSAALNALGHAFRYARMYNMAGCSVAKCDKIDGVDPSVVDLIR